MLEAFQSRNIVDSLWNGQILIQVKARGKAKVYQSQKCVGMRTSEDEVVVAGPHQNMKDFKLFHISETCQLF